MVKHGFDCGKTVFLHIKFNDCFLLFLSPQISGKAGLDNFGNIICSIPRHVISILVNSNLLLDPLAILQKLRIKEHCDEFRMYTAIDERGSTSEAEFWQIKESEIRKQRQFAFL